MHGQVWAAIEFINLPLSRLMMLLLVLKMLISTTEPGQQYQKSPKQAKAKYFSVNTWVLAVADQCAYNILAAIKDVTSLSDGCCSRCNSCSRRSDRNKVHSSVLSTGGLQSSPSIWHLTHGTQHQHQHHTTLPETDLSPDLRCLTKIMLRGQPAIMIVQITPTGDCEPLPLGSVGHQPAQVTGDMALAPLVPRDDQGPHLLTACRAATLSGEPSRRPSHPDYFQHRPFLYQLFQGPSGRIFCLIYLHASSQVSLALVKLV